ncbi:cystathionine beta-lyase/cystathionine gamma-synthase [Parabacteroides sp. PF5-6]|nr:cystathionine beta-lyase/cystathionine gamma-synthase [Parabacteroides sp. PF5-6]
MISAITKVLVNEPKLSIASATVRLSIGTEHIEDLLADLKQALQ